MSRYTHMTAKPVPQSEPLNEAQVKNNAGGYVFALDDWKRLDRFLILGSDANTYYQKAPALTRENAKCVQRCYAADVERTVARIVEVSTNALAPKNDSAIFALALGAADKAPEARKAALQALPRVCRTSTHLFQFLALCKALGRGWGRGLKTAVAGWYDAKRVESAAFQMVKYRAREGYTHKRALETSRPKLSARDTAAEAAARTALYKWAKGKPHVVADLPTIIAAHEEAMRPDTPKNRLIELIQTNNLPWEAIPTDVTKDPEVWEAMLPTMGLTAMIRNLGAMTSYGTLKPLGKNTARIVHKLADIDELRKARVHPFQLLLAQTVYSQGASYTARLRGKTDGLAWSPIGTIERALEKAFYDSFKTVTPTGKRTLIGLDVSGSMSSPLLNSPLRVCQGAAAMVMATIRTEPNWHVHAFADTFRKLNLTPSMSLSEVLEKTERQNFGGTDCSLPMAYALKSALEVDTFIVYTDNETWAGREHPVRTLAKYRSKSGIPAKLIVVGMTSTGFSIADPDDPGMLDVVGFDASAPAVMAEFARG